MKACNNIPKNIKDIKGLENFKEKHFNITYLDMSDVCVTWIP